MRHRPGFWFSTKAVCEFLVQLEDCQLEDCSIFWEKHTYPSIFHWVQQNLHFWSCVLPLNLPNISKPAFCLSIIAVRCQPQLEVVHARQLFDPVPRSFRDDPERSNEHFHGTNDNCILHHNWLKQSSFFGFESASGHFWFSKVSGNPSLASSGNSNMYPMSKLT